MFLQLSVLRASLEPPTLFALPLPYPSHIQGNASLLTLATPWVHLGYTLGTPWVEYGYSEADKLKIPANALGSASKETAQSVPMTILSSCTASGHYNGEPARRGFPLLLTG